MSEIYKFNKEKLQNVINEIKTDGQTRRDFLGNSYNILKDGEVVYSHGRASFR